MDGPTYVALSAQVSLQKHLEIVANNVANANTTGYKADRQLFQSYVQRLAVPGDAVAFVQDRATYIDMTDGPVSLTGGPLDIAIKGEGFFGLAGPNGTSYTRDGHLQLGSDGTLMNGSGLPITGNDGSPIQLPANFSNPRISGDGTIMVQVNGKDQQVGQIGVFRCTDTLALRKSGASVFTAPDGIMQPMDMSEPGGRIVQGGLEGSTVQPVTEIANLTELSRAYDRLQNLLSDDNDRERKMIETLGQLG